ncbi:TlpA family protein disulfide reductase [Lacinutrix sp. C3R15]|uniref:TlpA family protein disulfide reductase n=1 Tax=Flavobacteriaceae TaxID=49546 RepID=UPI001C0935C5|nr:MULTISPECIES: TlpA disulfide reductase family protein [Flavobacteriaceae]MBU2938477.1 TlpA family protein disulfide reductase [Lacinutrix sp. C3R15]MDO6621791.1 TlpA disulfide reductase family protein [Oceanihabitans sp. 1_MG-2023]
MLDETNIEFTNQPFLLKTKNEEENLNLSFNLESPRLFKFYSFKPMSTPFLIYVTPGDTLSYKLDDVSITFKGRNSAHYNFFKELNDLKLEYPRYNDELGVFDFKNKWKIDYQKKLHFLEQFKKSNNVSDLFYTKIKDVFKFQYINGLLNRNVFPKDAITNYSEYLNDLNIEIFNRNDQEDNVYFQLALTNYIYFVSKKNFKDNTYSKEALEYQLDLINNNLVSKAKEYAITKMIFEFDSHLISENANYLQDKIKIYLPQIKDKKYKVVLEQINERLNKINNQLSDKVFNSILLDIDGNSITLNEILQKQEGKIKVIDFWASWCAPCIKEIKKNHLYRKKLIQDRNVEFLYFSIDKNQESWRKKVAELNEFGMDKNQYVISVAPNSDLTTFFNVSSIPHYSILDINNEVILINSPSPEDTLEFNDIIKNEEL